MKKMIFSMGFQYYSWIANLGLKLMDFLPPLLRKAVLKCTLGGLGTHSLVDYSVYFRYPSKIRIGNSTTINRGCKFIASWHFPDVKIEIGNHVAVAPEVTFLTAGHDHTKLNLPDTAASIRVGDYAWIGARSIILQGVTIGEGAVVAAGSVVTRDVEPYTIVAGIPAKKINKRELSRNNCKRRRS